MFTIPNVTTAPVNPAPVADDQAYPDKVDFDILAAAFGGSYIISGCAVSPDAPESLNVAVAAGVVCVGGTAKDVTGGNVLLDAADPSPRYDLIVVDNTGAKSFVKGTAHATNPCFPNIPANRVVLAAVRVIDGTIAANDITDKRMILALPLVMSATAGTALFRTRVNGDAYYRITIDAEGVIRFDDGTIDGGNKGDVWMYRHATEGIKVDSVGTNTALFEVDGEVKAALLQLYEIAAPSTPAAGLAKLYVKADGRLYWKDDGGTEHTVSDHAQQHAITSGTDHSVAGGVDGKVLRQTGATTWAWETDYYAVSFVIDGGGASIVTGIKGSVHVPHAGAIFGWVCEVDNGTITVDVNKASYATTPSYASMTGGAGGRPNVSANKANRDISDPPGSWTVTSVVQGDHLQFEVDAVGGATPPQLATVTVIIRKT